jgi:hypothetical protein
MMELDARVIELNNFDIPTFDREEANAEPLELPQLSPNQLRIVFTGNLGRFQGLEAITAALLADDARLDDLQMVFMGEGAAKQGLIELVRSAPPSARHRVVFLPHGPVEHARALMRTGHLGLVSLVPGVIEFAYPSKTAAYLSEGLALLLAVEPSSSLAQDVEAWGVGSALPASSDRFETHEALASLVSRREEILSVRERALEVWRENFEAGAVLARWDFVLDGVLAGGRS